MVGQGLDLKPDEGCPGSAFDPASDGVDADCSGAGVAGRCSTDCSAGAVGVAGALLGAEEVRVEEVLDSAPDLGVESSPDVAVGAGSDAGAVPSVGVVEGDAGACCG